MSNALPKHLQGILWSQSIDDLDRDRDKVYIIHQIFSHGRMEDIVWVFNTYPKNEITEAFIKHPYKNYDAVRFYFVKNYLLGLKQQEFNEQLYVKNTPRDFR